MSYRDIPNDRLLEFSATPGFRGWEPFFTKESVTHPAKMNLNLLQWIIGTYTKPRDIVLDPMAGTGSTIILSAIGGRYGIAVEYEPRFCDMIRANILLAERQTTLTPKGMMNCIQGDARELSRLMKDSDAIVTSPPYGNRLSDVAVHDGDPARMGYRQSVDVLLTSPPFGPSTKGGGIYREGYRAPGEKKVSDPGLPERHSRPLSDDPNNIDNLEYGEVNTVVTSPPYEASVKRGDEGPGASGKDSPTYEERLEQPKVYSNNPENIGNLASESYLQAMLQVYRECHKVLAPWGNMILVVKNFIRDKSVVRLDLDTIKLCDAAGFTLRDRWYFRLPTKSFWRVLYSKKYPEVPEVEYEDVLIFEKKKRTQTLDVKTDLFPCDRGDQTSKTLLERGGSSRVRMK